MRKSPSHERIIGEVDGERPGPTVVVTGGLHGNEPAGAVAAGRLIESLAPRAGRLRGRVLALAGNLGALARGTRFVDRDLNRRWFTDDLAALSSDGSGPAEDHEQRELLELFEREIAASSRPVVFFDLHTTSGACAPFACMNDTLANREIALTLPIPIILGLEEVIDGTMLGYLSDLGHRTVAVEGGQNDDPETVERLVGLCWLVLLAAGSIEPADVPELADHRARLDRASDGLPRVVEVLHRHVVEPEDGFEMEPGFASFDPIEAGRLVARDARGPILTPCAGRMLLPRYQGQGEDGFFVARDVRPVWLGVSALLRRAGLGRLAPLLPGVRRDPDRPEHLVVSRRALFGHARGVMHLLGYRSRRPGQDDPMVFSLRRPRRSARLEASSGEPARP